MERDAHVDLRRVRYFLALCADLSFSGTARRLHITQPALSKAIRTLESELGGRLIRREGRKTHLTEFGRSLRERFEELEAAAVRVESAARRQRAGLDGRLRIALLPGAGGRGFHAFFDGYRRSRPDVALEFVDVPDHEALGRLAERGDIECAVIVAPDGLDTGMRQVTLAEHALKIVHPVPHALSRVARAGPAELRRAAGERVERTLEDLERGAAFLPAPGAEGVVDTDSRCPYRLQSFVAGGFGTAVVPADVPVRPDLDATPLDFAAHGLSVRACLPRGRADHAAVRSLARHLDGWWAVPPAEATPCAVGAASRGVRRPPVPIPLAVSVDRRAGHAALG